MKPNCVDRVVGDILAGWRYDISGITAEMRGDYEQHFAECAYCRARQRLHRTIDIGLIILAALSACVFLLAFGAIVHFDPRHALILELAALAGFALSALIWLVVAMVTPAPMLMVDAARVVARRGYDRLPPQVRERIPEELRIKISGQS
jgi:hypothetical protein